MVKETRDPAFGPPPVLADESVENYQECYRRIFEHFIAKDAVELRLVRDYADHDWDLCRWRRMKIELMSSIPEMYLDQTSAMLTRVERINQLIENAEKGRNRCYRAITRHREMLKNIGLEKRRRRSDKSAA